MNAVTCIRGLITLGVFAPTAIFASNLDYDLNGQHIGFSNVIIGSKAYDVEVGDFSFDELTDGTFVLLTPDEATEAASVIKSIYDTDAGGVSGFVDTDAWLSRGCELPETLCKTIIPDTEIDPVSGLDAQPTVFNGVDAGAFTGTQENTFSWKTNMEFKSINAARFTPVQPQPQVEYSLSGEHTGFSNLRISGMLYHVEVGDFSFAELTEGSSVLLSLEDAVQARDTLAALYASAPAGVAGSVDLIPQLSRGIESTELGFTLIPHKGTTSSGPLNPMPMIGNDGSVGARKSWIEFTTTYNTLIPVPNYNTARFTPVKTGLSIDIKPKSDRNRIDLRKNRFIRVAVLTTNTAQGDTDDFYALDIDPLSVRFGPADAMEAHNRGHVKDIDGDGDMDLVLRFRTRETEIQCGDTQATLTGRTWGGSVVSGVDTIETVGCSKHKSGGKHKKKEGDH